MALDRFRPKRILFVTQLDIWGMSTKKSGATMGNQSLYNTLLGYSRHGYKVHLFTSADHLDSRPDLPENVTVHRHPLPGLNLWRKFRTLKRWLLPSQSTRQISFLSAVSDLEYRHYLVLHKVLTFYFWAGLWVFLLMCRYRFDLLYGYEIFGAPIAWFWGRVFRRPVISRFQGTLMSRYLHEPEKLHYNWTHWIPMCLPVDLLIMANDGTQGDKVLEYLNVPRVRWVFWRNGVELGEGISTTCCNVHFRQKKTNKAEMVLFTSASRMNYWKRVDRMIRAASLVPQDRQFQLVLIGDGEKRLALESLVKDLGVGARVHFAGPLPHRSVIEWHSAADVLISTFDVSNVGNQLLEAQVLGKPYIAVSTGDTGRVVKHGVNGLLVQDPDDYQAIADAMTQLIDDPLLRARLAEGARAFGRGHILTWPQRMDKEIDAVETRLGWNKTYPCDQWKC